MVKIGLVTDSSSDIPPEIAGKYGIEIKIDEILVTRITTVISAHTGPGIWGIAVSPRILP